MESKQSSIYRAIENLLFWVMEVSDRAPKGAAFAATSTRLINAYVDALETCSMALNQPNLRSRVDLIGLVKVHLDTAAAIIRVWHQWSSRKGLKAGDKIKRILTDKQLEFYFIQMDKIGRQLTGWYNSTFREMEKLKNDGKEG